MNILKENWMKISILIIVLTLVIVFGIYLNQKNSIEKDRLTAERIDKETQTAKDLSINTCITNAYTELKTLQNNFFVGHLYTCKVNSALCSYQTENDSVKKSQDEAFNTYTNEWIPQCKLGNRVYIHYETWTLQDLMKGDGK